MANSNIEVDHSLRLLAKSSIIVFIGLIVSKISTYLYRIIIARGFGPETYGVFSLSIMIVGWFVLFSNLGLAEGIVRYIPYYVGKKKINNARYLFRKSFYILLTLGLILGIILFFLSSFIANEIFKEPALFNFLRVFSFLIPLSIILKLLLSSLQAYQKVGWTTLISSILATSIKVVIISALIFIGFETESIMFSYLFEAIIVVVIAFFVCKKVIPKLFIKDNLNKRKGIIKEVLAYSLPLFFAGMAWTIFNFTDSFIIGYFKGAREVGIYNAAIPIAMLLMISSQLFMQLFFPLVTKYYSQGKKEIVKQLSQQVGKWIFTINLPIFILLLIFPEIFLAFFFGKEYVTAANALRFFSIGIFSLTFAFEISYKLIAMKGKSKVLSNNIIFISIANVLLNIWLVPKYGINGAAISTMSSLLALSIISIAQSRYYLSIVPLRRKMLNILASSFLSSAILIYLKNFMEINLISFLILAIFFLILYALFIFIFKGLDKNDLMIIKSAIKRIKK